MLSKAAHVKVRLLAPDELINVVNYLPFDLAMEQATLFLVLVYHHVLFEVRAASERLIAVVTLEWLLARVSSRVPDEVGDL